MARFITKPGPPPPKYSNSNDKDGKDREATSEPESLTKTNAKPSYPQEKLLFSDEFSQPTAPTPGNEEVEDVCVDWWIYAKPIEVYLCMQPPEKLAWDIFLWERLENIGIDQCIDVHPASPCQPETNIPPEATYVVVGDTVSQNPYGHTILFCRKVLDRKGGQEKYTPITAFFWSFINSNSTTVQSLSEYFHTRAAPSQLVTLYERIPFQDEVRFPEVFGMITGTVNREMHLLKMNQRILRNVMGTNRARPTRWRCIVGREPPVEVVLEKKKSGKKAASKKKSARKAAPKKKGKGRT